MTTRSQHTGWISAYLIQHGVSKDQAKGKAKAALAAFLKDEEIKFGDSRYNWCEGAARITAAEYLGISTDGMMAGEGDNAPEGSRQLRGGSFVPTEAQHIGWLRQHLIKHGVAEDQAQEQAEAALAAFLKDEEIEFGDDRYNWGKQAAGITAAEYLANAKEGKA